MEHKISFANLKKMFVILVLMTSIQAFSQANGPALEMAAGAGNTTANGPTTTSQIIYFQNNTDNISTGSTFVTHVPTLSATYAISNVRASNVINFGQTTTGATTIFDLMTNQGAPADANFTSAGASTGTGILVGTNRAVRLYVQTQPLRTANRPTNSTTDIADLTITFNRPVNNPVIHIGGLGGTSSSTPALGFSAIMELTSSVGTNVSLTRLSGNNTTGFQSTSTIISNGSATFTASGTNSGSGSVIVNGTGITSLTFKISLKGDGSNTTVASWSPASDATTGEAFTVGFSTLESDIQLTKTMSNNKPLIGGSTTFTVTATNNGPSNNANINIADAFPSGYNFGTPIPSTGTYSSGVWNIPALANGASATLTVTGTVLSTGNYTNTATVTSASVSDSNTGNNRATAARIPDSDNDGVFDDVDLDDDNDGIPDALEDACTKTNSIANGSFAGGSSTSWATSYATTPNTTGGITFNALAGSLDIYVDNPGNLYSGNIILANTTPFNLRAGVLYNFSSSLGILLGTNNTNFSWVLIDGSNNIVQTIQSYKTLASGSGDVQISFTQTTYPVSFYSNGTGQYRLAMTWITNSTTAGNGHDVRIDDVTLLAPCDTNGDGIPNYLDLDSDGDGCFDAIEGDENVLPSNLNANGSINIGTTGGVGTTAGTNNGIPNLVNPNGAADIGPDIGQGVGESQNNLATSQCIDTDGDGVPDNIDLDDDNDGIPDYIEDACVNEGTPVYIENFGTGARTTNAFVTNHTYSLAGSINDGTYAVITSNSASDTYSQTDTTGNLDAGNPIISAGSTAGRYLMINVGNNLANQSIFVVPNRTVTPGTRYKFRIDMAGLAVGATAVPQLLIVIKDTNGNVLASANSNSIGMANDDIWRRLFLNFTATTSTVNLEIISLQPNTSGNDIGLDNIILTPSFICDNDGDGIPNSLDLDSDGDGCTDAIEGGSPFTTSNLVTATGTLASQTPNQNLGNTVGSTVTTIGIPTIALAGQSLGQSQDASRNDCADSDIDGIPDWQDLDDDNDGILDCIENGLSGATISSIFQLRGSATQLGSNEARLTPDAATQSGQMWSNGKVDFAKSFTLTYRANLGSKDAGADGIAAVFHNSPAGNNAVGASGDGIGARGILNGLVLEIDTYDNGTAIGDIANDHSQIWASNNQTSTGFLTSAVDLGNLEDGAYHNVIIVWNAFTKNLSYTVDGINAGSYTFPPATPITSYFGGVSKVFFGFTASTGNASNDQRVSFVDFCNNLPLELDTDGDGIPNYLDLDSDGDGCTDAIEGGSPFTTANLVVATGSIATQSPNLNLGNNVGTSPTTIGVPTIAGTGQTVGQSQDATRNDCLDSDGDTIPDWLDIDDDNDGILDTVECGFVCGNPFINGGFETPVVNTVGTQVSQNTAGIGWQTTATDGLIELWPSGSVPSAEGNQFAELNATQVSTLYQTFCLNGAGGTINWSVKHRGRNGVDVAAVKFGTTIATAQSSTAVQTMTDNNTAWGSYSGIYNVPVGTTTLVIAFQSISAAGGDQTIGNFIDDVQVVLNQVCLDTDGDGIPNSLDLDSDGDGCSDALEGAADVTSSQLVTAGGTVTGGSTSVNQNLCATDSCVNASGLPQFTTLPVGYSNTTGQAIGDSQNALINACYCYKKPVVNNGVTVPTNHGITALNRAGSGNSEWPTIRQSAWTVLEANTKGFVVNRVAFEDADNNVATPTTPVGIPIANYVEGMMVYDTVINCLKIFNGSIWGCYSTQTCP